MGWQGTAAPCSCETCLSLFQIISRALARWPVSSEKCLPYSSLRKMSCIIVINIAVTVCLERVGKIDEGFSSLCCCRVQYTSTLVHCTHLAIVTFSSHQRRLAASYCDIDVHFYRVFQGFLQKRN